MASNIDLSTLKRNNRMEVNPMDLLPKKKVETRTTIGDSLGDLSAVILKENEEADKIAKDMIEDMKAAKEKGLQPTFRQDLYATEGMQPIELNKEVLESPGIETNIKDAPKPSETLEIEHSTSVKNYIEPPVYVNKGRMNTPIKVVSKDGGQTGSRSVLKDNGIHVDTSIQSAPTSPEVQKAQSDETMISDNELQDLLGDDFITFDDYQDEIVEEEDDFVDSDDEFSDLIKTVEHVEKPKQVVKQVEPQVKEEEVVEPQVLEEPEPVQVVETQVEPEIVNTIVDTQLSTPIDYNEIPEIKGEQIMETKEYIKEEPTVQEAVNTVATDSIEDEIEQSIKDEFGSAEQDEEVIPQEEQEEMLNTIKSKIREKLRPQKFDISSFTVATPAKVKDLFNNKKQFNQGEIDWYLPATGINITMSKFGGVEITSLGGNTEKSVRNSNFDILRLIYDHITNPTKPEFDIFIRSIKYADLEQIYFAILRASFKDANYIPYYCNNQKCKEVDIALKSFDDMIEFYNDEEKDKFYSHLETATYNFIVDSIEMERVLISNEYAIDIKLPSLYDILIEPTYLPKQYRVENKDNINVIAFIEKVYRIDYAKKAFVPIDYNLKTDDEAKIIQNKFRLYVQFLKSLSSDDYTFLTSLINRIAIDKTDICEFVVPEHQCPKCGLKTPKEKTTALKMLFTRHQLATLANI